MDDLTNSEMRRRALTAMALLLSYPNAEWVSQIGELTSAAKRLLPASRFDELEQHLAGQSLVEVQEYYVSLFDRSRAVSLHLFEHSHGDARERGDAMVRLSNLYREHGFELSLAELPDYLPAVCEFLGLADVALGASILKEAQPILRQLCDALHSRRSPYAVVVDGLLQLATGTPVQVQDASESDAPSVDPLAVDFDALDAQWQEESVSFSPRAALEGSPFGGTSSDAAPLVRPERLVRRGGAVPPAER